MDASLAGGVGAIAEDVLLDIVVVTNGGGVHGERRTKLVKGGRGRGGGGKKRYSEVREKKFGIK